ncbi:hypothetical protein Ancab_015937 [Ancistrocladus abbreviatus]
MYPLSSSSSSQQQQPIGGAAAPNNHHLLTRYGSAPSSLLTSTVDSVRGFGSPLQCFSLVHESANSNICNNDNNSISSKATTTSNLQRSYGFNDIAGGGGGRVFTRTAGSNLTTSAGGGSSSSPCCSTSLSGSPSLIRHSSSPAGLLHQLTSDIGFPVRKGSESNNSPNSSHKLSRLSSQLSFTKQESLSQISEFDGSCVNVIDGVGSKRSSLSHSASTAAGFSISSWDESDNSTIVFSASPNKRAKHINDDILHDLAAIDSQFSLSQTALDIGSVENLLQIPQDSVPCKIRAKRGCATHPRSIAERERRTRISGKLKKLQELVPNMDKQTSYSDMLDLAVQHIKGLQSQIQKLNKEMDNCTCGCKKIIQR